MVQSPPTRGNERLLRRWTPKKGSLTFVQHGGGVGRQWGRFVGEK